MTDEQIAFSIAQDEGVRHRRFRRCADERHRRDDRRAHEVVLRQDGEGGRRARPTSTTRRPTRSASSNKKVGHGPAARSDATAMRATADAASAARPIVSLRGVGKTFANGTRGAAPARPRRPARRVPVAARPLRLRQVHGAAPDRRRSATPTARQIEWPARRRAARDLGFVFQEPTLMPWASVFDNVWLPLRLAGPVARDADGRRRWRRSPCVGLAGFAEAYPRELSGGMKMRVSIARALVTRPRAAADGRALRRARRDHPLQAQRRPPARCKRELGCDGRLRHPFGVRERLPVDRIVVMAPRPGRVVAEITDRGALAARRGFPHLARAIREQCRRGLGRAGAGHRRVERGRHDQRRMAAAERSRRSGRAGAAAGLQWLLPTPRARSSLSPAGRSMVRVNDIPPYVLPAPSLIADDAGQRLADPGPLAPGHADDHLAGARARARRRRRRSRSCSPQSRWWRSPSFPFAVILQVTPIVAIAPLLLIYVDQPASAVLICAWIVAFFPILSNTTLGLQLGRPQPARPVPISTAPRAGRRCCAPASCPRRCPISSAACGSPAASSLIGAVVAEIAAGSAGVGSGLAFRIIESRLPAQHPAHVRGAGADLAASGIVDLLVAVRCYRICCCGAGTKARIKRES